MFKLPRSVVIGAYTWKVKRVKSFKGKADAGRVQTGLCNSKNLTIYIRRDLKEVDVRIIFFHECLHAIEYSHDITLGEKTISRLDNYLICFIQDNQIDFR